MSDTPNELDPTISVVVPVHNESANLGSLIERLESTFNVAGVSFEIVFVDDGSTDDSLTELEKCRQCQPCIRIVELSRNFGKEVALSAGIDHASGQAVITMDADLQHPPETILEFIAQWRNGREVVYGIKSDRAGESLLRRIYSRVYFAVFNRMADVKLPRSPSDFCLLDRKAVEAIKQLPERARFLKGLLRWIGFNQAEVEYNVGTRSGGEGQLALTKLIAMGVDALIAFSALPLKIWFYVGLLISTVTFIFGLTIIIDIMVHGRAVPGFATLIIAVLFFGGIQLLTLGIIGAYLERVFTEVKNRPLYIVRNRHGFSDGN